MFKMKLPSPTLPSMGYWKREYGLLRDEENCEKQTISFHPRSWPTPLWIFFCLNALLFLFSLLLLAVAYDNLHQLRDYNNNGYTTTMNNDLKRVSAYSSIFDAVDLQPNLQKFNGAVNDNSSIFRQDPSPQVDEAWDMISAEGFEVTTAPLSALSKAGHEPSQLIRAPPSWDRGNDAAVVQIDVFHQIHCLNELRKEIHFDYYYKHKYGGRENVPPEHMIHKKHCIHILLQNLMCHADVDLIPHHWVHYDGLNQSTRPWAEPLADFNLVKTCRDFGGLLEWTKNNAVQNLPTRWRELKYQEGEPVMDGSSGYFETVHNHYH